MKQQTLAMAMAADQEAGFEQYRHAASWRSTNWCEWLFSTVGRVLQARALEMHQTPKDQQWYFGMKMHMGQWPAGGLEMAPLGSKSCDYARQFHHAQTRLHACGQLDEISGLFSAAIIKTKGII